MSRKLTLEERKFALKKYWKTENAQDVIRDWCLHFCTDPPTRLTIYKELRRFVFDAFANFDHDLCTYVYRNVLSRCRECIEAESLQFEY